MKYAIHNLSKDIDFTTPMHKTTDYKPAVLDKPTATATTFHNVGGENKWKSLKEIQELLKSSPVLLAKD
jgi:hypothetical protein